MRQRILWADSLKGILIILVVLGHSIQVTLKGGCTNSHLWNYIYSFHMPAFMAISGFLSYKMVDRDCRRSFKEYVLKCVSLLRRRSQQLVIPFVLWALIKLLFYEELTFDSIIRVFMYPDGSFWFLWILFLIAATFKILDCLSVSLKLDIDVLIIIFSILFTLFMVVTELRLFGYQFFAYYFLFYSLGYFLNKYSWHFISNKRNILFFAAIWSILAWFWNMHELPVFLKGLPLPGTLLQYAYRFITALIAIIAIWGISPLILDRKSFCNVPFLILGKISLGIYVVHQLLIPIFYKLIQQNTTNQYLVIAFTFSLSLSFSWLIVWILGKWSFTNRLLLGKV